MPRIIPGDLLDAGRPKRIICHWTAGAYAPSALDRQHYHVLIDGTGAVHAGRYPIRANDNTADGEYAAHTRGANTGSIGVALCAMAGATPDDVGRYPITTPQWQALPLVLADLCEHYKIGVTPSTVLTHAEVQRTLGVPQNGKWDISVRPDMHGVVSPTTAGGYIRRGVLAALASPSPAPAPPPAPAPDPTLQAPAMLRPGDRLLVSAAAGVRLTIAYLPDAATGERRLEIAAASEGQR